MKKMFFLIGIATIIIAIVGIYFFQIQPHTNGNVSKFYIQDFFNPIWEFIEGIANVLKSVWEWFTTLIGFVGNIIPKGA